MSHLGDRVAALVDGQLTVEAVDRATMHLVSCRPCRDLVEVERLTKARLTSLLGPDPTPDLVGRLLAMGGPAGPLPPRPGYVPGTARPQPVPLRPVAAAGTRSAAQRWTLPSTRPATRTTRMAAESTPAPVPSTRPAGRPPVLTTRRTRLAAAVLGALSVLGVGVAGVAAGTSAGVTSPGSVSPQLGTTTFLAPAGTGLVSTNSGARGSLSLLQAPPADRLGFRLLAGH
ncbi:MAG TPA: hypothetical protein VMT69_16020 [Kineosporiaceae bacterium]|nr:hypothetical protein [Kineosporiaceae bacterium]